MNTNQYLQMIKDELERMLKEEIGSVPVIIETAENSCSYMRDCAIRFSIPIIKESEEVK
jgi:hypothetical protein